MRQFVLFGLSLIVPAAQIVVQAQEPAPSPKASAYTSTIGEVSAIDAGAKQLTLKTDAGAPATVAVNDKTHFLKMAPGEKDLKKAAEIQFSDIKAGDRVLARTHKTEDNSPSAAVTIIVMTKEELAKHQERTQQEWRERGLTGTVTAVNAATKEVTLKLMGSDPKQVVIGPSDKVAVRRYAPDSVKFSDAQPATKAEIRVGDTVRVLGTKNEDGTQVQPEEIVFGTFVRQAGTILAVDATAGTIRMNNLQTKKPVLVKVNSSTVLKKLPEQMAHMMAMAQSRGAPGGPDGASGSVANGAGAGAGSGSKLPPGGPGEQAGLPPGSRQPGTPPPGGPGSWNGQRPEGAGGSGGPGGMGPRFDPSRILDRAPAITLADLKPGDAVMVSSSGGPDPTSVTAITLVAGVEPLLTAPRKPGSGQDPMGGSWNFEMSVPQ